MVCYVFLMYIFKCMVCPNETPGFFIFCVSNALLLVYIGNEFGGNDVKVIRDVATFTLKCKM